jgi:hypothetical protein
MADHQPPTATQIHDALDPWAFYGTWFELADGKPQQNVLCCFHDDTSPSLSLDLDHGRFHCKSSRCPAGDGGGMFEFWMLEAGVNFPTACAQLADHHAIGPRDGHRRTRQALPAARDPIAEREVQLLVESIRAPAHRDRRAALMERRGWSDGTLDRWEIGWHPHRGYAIPVRDAEGNCRNIRFYRLDPGEGQHKFASWVKGYGSNRLFNVAALSRHQQIILCEGEPDTITAAQHGVENVVSTTTGAGKWDDSFSPEFVGKDVVVVYDVDDAGRAGAAAVAEALWPAAASLKIVNLPLDSGGDLSDYLRDHTAEDLRMLIQHTPDYEPPPSERPEIVISTDISDMVDRTESAMLRAGVGIYQRAGLLVRVTRGPSAQARRIARDADAPAIQAAPKAWVREATSQTARWVKIDTTNGCEDRKDALPPPWAVDTLMDRGSWQFPWLAGVIETPCLRADGTVLDQHGYDTRTGLLYHPTADCPPIPSNPTRAEALTALDALREPFQDFPFASEGERAPREPWVATLAAVLTVFARHAVDGALPMFVVSAPVRGSGKTRLVDAISVIATGRTATRTVHAPHEDEERKRLVSLGLAGDPLILIDNVERDLQSSVLAAAITSRRVRDRLLGGNRMVTVPMDGVWFVTGNNLQVRGDLSRRIVPIHLDPGVEFPEDRTNFHHPDLLGWVRKHRGDLCAAALTILRAFVVAGKPQGGVSQFGSFEEWTKLVAACVLWITDVDPLRQRIRLRAHADIESEQLTELLRTWAAAIGVGVSAGVTLAALLDRFGEGVDDQHKPLSDALQTLVTSRDGPLTARPLSYRLRKFKDRICGGLVLRNGQHGEGGKPWWVEDIHDDRQEA